MHSRFSFNIWCGREIDGVATIMAGVGVAHFGFAPIPIVGDITTIASFVWAAILGVFMWKKSRVKEIAK